MELERKQFLDDMQHRVDSLNLAVDEMKRAARDSSTVVRIEAERRLIGLVRKRDALNRAVLALKRADAEGADGWREAKAEVERAAAASEDAIERVRKEVRS